MKMFIATAVLCFAATALAQHNPDAHARILSQEADVSENDFRYRYETENGIRAEEQGREADGIQAQGAFSYTGDDGQVYAINYAADQNGFQPQGAHLPVAPPTPEAILEALAKNAADEAAGIFDDGKYNAAQYGEAATAGAAPSGFANQYRAQASASAGFRKTYRN